MLGVGIISFLIYFCYLIFSYGFVNEAILSMLIPVYPRVEKILPFRDFVVVNRGIMTIIWLGMILILGGVQFWLFFRERKLVLSKISFLFLITILVLASLSYPIFSNDIFNYLFGSKTVVYYHQNPFLMMPKVFFENDLWLRFTDNIDNIYYYIGNTPITYFYGPVFLLYTLIPFLFFGAVEFQKLFWGYKLMSAGLFLITGFLIKKINPKDNLVWAYWFFNPFLITELLINSHNDLVMIFFFILAIYVFKKKKILGWFSFLLSVLTKWVSAGLFFIFLFKENNRYWVYKIVGLLILLANALFQRQIWYYSWIYMVFPFAKLKKSSWFLILIFQLILLLSYTRFIWLGHWISWNWMNLARWGFLGVVLTNEFGWVISNKNLNRRKIGSI